MRISLVSEHASPLPILAPDFAASDLGGHECGGQNVHVAELARHLAHAGCDVIVHTRRDHRELPSVVEVMPNLLVHHLDAGPPEPVARDELRLLVPEMAGELMRFWSGQGGRRDRPVDVVHAHFWMSGLAALMASAQAGVPLVQTFHALGSVKRRHLGHEDTSPPGRLTYERLLIAAADLVLATCQDEVTELVALGGGLDRIRVVPCGVSAHFTPDGPSWPDRRDGVPRVVTVSRLVPRKGIGDAIAAIAAHPTAELLVVGGRSSDPADAAEQRRLSGEARRAGVSDRVRFIGGVDHETVASIMRSADVVVCPPWYEPFGIVPLEAMACGVPVVGTSVGGLLDTVERGVTGLLVPARRPDLLGAALTTLLRDSELRSAMGRAAAARAERYRWPSIAQQTVTAYEHVLRVDVAGIAP
jgi:D-inositol-3-phosphate glycosyltransferase